ncbi:hypothetical protein D3C80_1229830 [compost metagenome]
MPSRLFGILACRPATSSGCRACTACWQATTSCSRPRMSASGRLPSCCSPSRSCSSKASRARCMRSRSLRFNGVQLQASCSATWQALCHSSLCSPVRRWIRVSTSRQPFSSSSCIRRGSARSCSTWRICWAAWLRAASRRSRPRAVSSVRRSRSSMRCCRRRRCASKSSSSRENRARSSLKSWMMRSTISCIFASRPLASLSSTKRVPALAMLSSSRRAGWSPWVNRRRSRRASFR